MGWTRSADRRFAGCGPGPGFGIAHRRSCPGATAGNRSRTAGHVVAVEEEAWWVAERSARVPSPGVGVVPHGESFVKACTGAVPKTS